ncbi:hypothetical protein ABZ477_15620 [Microbacterium sp. NPDC019599]|uniref:hypothetical protein n=1 Tax=Microbacterium sp. NPDC019599 TaxID=3154690 RepID=UPI0033FD9342
MTMIDDVTRTLAPEDRESVRCWHEVEAGYWAGSADGAFLGTVECTPAGRFAARDALSSHLGEYETLALAQSAVIIESDWSNSGGSYASDGRAPRGRASLRAAAQYA